MNIQSQENSDAGGTDEDIIAYHTQKYIVPTGESLWFKGTGTTIFYQYTTDTTQPAISDTNWIEVTTNISGPGGGGGNSELGTIWGFGKAVSGTGGTGTGTGGGGSWNFTDQTVDAALAPTAAWQSLDLSSFVGSNSAYVVFEAYGNTSGYSLNLDLRKPGSSINPNTGIDRKISGTVTQGFLIINGIGHQLNGVTDSSGVIEYRQSNVIGTGTITLKIIAYSVDSGDTDSGGGPRAYVAFDGTATDLTASITNSHNVASITDGRCQGSI